MDLASLRAPRPVPPKLSVGDRKVQVFLRDLEKIKTSKRPRKQVKRCEDVIYRVVQALRRQDSDHLLYTTCIWTLISVFRMFPEETKEMMLVAGVPGVLHAVLSSGVLTGSMRQYTSELCFFLSSNEPYPEAGSIPQTGPLLKLPEVSGTNRYSGQLDDISVATSVSDASSSVPEGHRDHSKYAFVPYRINDQNMKKLDALFQEGYEKQIAASMPNPQFMSRFGFVAANGRKAKGTGGDGTGTGITGENWQQHSDSDEDSDIDNEDYRNNDEGSVNSTISSGSRSLAYSASSGGTANASLAGSVISGRYTFGSGISGVGAPIHATENHGIGIGIHNRQIGKYAGSALGGVPGVGFGKIVAIPTLNTVGTRDYDSWHERHAPTENPFCEEATPLHTHYQPRTISSERARSTHFRIGGFGQGPGSQRDMAGVSALPALGADIPRQTATSSGKRPRDGFELTSMSMSQSLSQLSKDPLAGVGRSFEYRSDAVSNLQAPNQFTDSPAHKHQHTEHHHGGHRKQRDLAEDSWNTHLLQEGSTFTQEQLNSPFFAPGRSIASSQYGERPSDRLEQAANPHAPSTALYLVQPQHRLQTAGSPTRVYPRLTGAVHARRDHSPQHPSTAPHLHGHKRAAVASARAGKSEIDDLLAQLDPLSLSLNAVRTTSTAKSKRLNTVGRRNEHNFDDNDGNDTASHDSWSADDSDIEDANDDNSAASATDAGFFDSHIVDAPDSKFNPFIARKKMRIRAEKLVDHNFTRKLFIKKATTAQAQNLIARMESLLTLMDPQSTGFVTWECFARLIMAVAPSHLLRSDVTAFMAAQTDSDQDLVDYKEFIISGKVMIIDKQKTRKDNLPVMGWLNRQKTYAGEESTHTWQNHIKWYQSRKSKAVVWLMRRATRSMKYSVVLAEAEKFLLNQRKRALAVTYLLEVGYVAVNSQGHWKEAKRALLKRAMHARRWSETTRIAQAWLANLSKGVVEQLRIEQELEDALEESSVASLASSIESVMHPVRKKQADYSTFYKLHQYNRMAFTFLTNTAQKSLKHCERQDAVQVTLKAYGYRMLMHQMYVESARSWLKSSGERAYQYCMMRDDTMKNLFRTGQAALQYMIRQENALAWLLNRGKEGIIFMRDKSEALDHLITHAQRTKKFLNARENAHAALVVRRQKAVILVARKYEARIFLAKQPLGLWANQDKVSAMQVWLANRGRQAIAYLEKRHKAFLSLQFTAGKASTVLRKQNMAFTDLQQFGQESKILRFAEQCKTVPQYWQRVHEERKRVKQIDAKHAKERVAMHKTLRWKTELYDAFEWISVTITPVAYQGGKKNLIGRFGFAKLMQYGKLLGTTRHMTYDFFKSVDSATQCFVSFDMVWTWFLYHAEQYEAAKLTPQGKALKFTLNDIISAEERAMVTILKRVNSEKVEFSSEMDWDAVKEKQRRDAAEASSSEEDEPVMEIDDDVLFSDPRYLGNADIGRMMRYLTKRKQQREREALQQAYEAEQRAIAVQAAKAAEAARRSAGTAVYTPSKKEVPGNDAQPVSPVAEEAHDGATK